MGRQTNRAGVDLVCVTGRIAALALAMLLLPSPAALAAWGPGQIAVEGELTNLAGEPVAGPVNAVFSLYSSPDAVNAVWSETHLGVKLAQGRFQVILGKTTPLDNPAVFETNGGLFIGVSVDGGLELPRVPLSSIGYSMQAKHAAVADSLSGPASDLSCAGCVSDSEVSFVFAAGDGKGGAAVDVKCSGCISGTDIEDGAVAFADLGASGCAAGQILKRNAGNTAWTCAADDTSAGDITEVKAGSGLTGGGSEGSVTLSLDKPTVETYAKGVCYDSAGELTGALDGTYINEGQGNSVSSAMISDGTITNADIAAGAAIAFSKLAGVAAAVHTHAADDIAGGTFDASSTYVFPASTTVKVNGPLIMDACPSGYSLAAANLCLTAWRGPGKFFNAQRDCFDEGAHVCTYAEFYHMWSAAANPSFTNGDWIGDVVADDGVLCVNNAANIDNFEGQCDKGDSHRYRCCMGRGR